MQISNKYPAACAVCGARVEPRAGIATGNHRTGWTVTHTPARWMGSPISGRFVGGCPTGTAEIGNTTTVEVTA